MPSRADKLIFSGECPDCGRDVRRSFPYESAFLETNTTRLFCAECGRPVLVSKET